MVTGAAVPAPEAEPVDELASPEGVDPDEQLASAKATRAAHVVEASEIFMP